ncbi:MAG: hypothetical protein AAGD96_03020 [Chloroflexota bacterium]
MKKAVCSFFSLVMLIGCDELVEEAEPRNGEGTNAMIYLGVHDVAQLVAIDDYLISTASKWLVKTCCVLRNH